MADKQKEIIVPTGEQIKEFATKKAGMVLFTNLTKAAIVLFVTPKVYHKIPSGGGVYIEKEEAKRLIKRKIVKALLDNHYLIIDKEAGDRELASSVSSPKPPAHLLPNPNVTEAFSKSGAKSAVLKRFTDASETVAVAPNDVATQ